MVSTLGMLTGAFLISFNGWRLISIWAKVTPGLQLAYWIGFFIVIAFSVWSTTAMGRNALASENLSPTTIALIGICLLSGIILALITV